MAEQIQWKNLRGKTFKTINGAEFSVMNVTRKSVIIRPKSGRRNYDLSISDELEKALDAPSW